MGSRPMFQKRTWSLPASWSRCWASIACGWSRSMSRESVLASTAPFSRTPISRVPICGEADLSHAMLGGTASECEFISGRAEGGQSEEREPAGIKVDPGQDQRRPSHSGMPSRDGSAKGGVGASRSERRRASRCGTPAREFGRCLKQGGKPIHRGPPRCQLPREKPGERRSSGRRPERGRSAAGEDPRCPAGWRGKRRRGSKVPF